MPNAIKVVLSWHPQTKRKMPKDFKWGCSECDLVYMRHTDAVVCCMDKKTKPHWYRGQKPTRKPVGRYRRIENGLFEILPLEASFCRKGFTASNALTECPTRRELEEIGEGCQKCREYLGEIFIE